MKTQHQYQYHYAISSMDLIDLFMTEHFYHERYKMAGISDYTIEEFGKNGNCFVITVKRKIALRKPRQLPLVLKKLIKDENTVINTFSWELLDGDSRRGEYSLKLEGIPAEMHGSMLIQPADDEAGGSLLALNTQISSAIPMVGKKIESLYGEKIASGFHKDFQATQAYIEKHLVPELRD